MCSECLWELERSKYNKFSFVLGLSRSMFLAVALLLLCFAVTVVGTVLLVVLRPVLAWIVSPAIAWISLAFFNQFVLSWHFSLACRPITAATVALTSFIGDMMVFSMSSLEHVVTAATVAKLWHGETAATVVTYPL